MNKRNGKSQPKIPPAFVWHDFRCHNCGRLLFRAIIVQNCKVEVRCPRCSRMTLVTEEGIITSVVPIVVAAVQEESGA
jgi:phage FluMu protein Com